MTTKVEHINSAYSQLRISGITVNPTPEDTETALVRLEDLMWEYYGRTLDFNYNFEDYPQSNSESGIEKVHNTTIASNLAMRLLPDFGKDATPELSSIARSSFSVSSAVLARKRLQGVKHSSRMPIGTGNRWTGRYDRYYPPSSPAETSANNSILLNGEIEDYAESFQSWLQGESISSYSVTVGDGLTLLDGIIDPDNPPPAIPPTGDISADPNFATLCGAGNWTCLNFVIGAGEAVIGTSTYSTLTNTSFVWDPAKTYTVTVQYNDATKGFAYGQVLCGNEVAFGEAGNVQVDDAPDGSLDRVTGIQTTTVTGVTGVGFIYENVTEGNDAISQGVVELKIEEVVAPYVPIDSYVKDGTVNYRVQADASPFTGAVCVEVNVTTDTGRVEKRKKLVDVQRAC